MIEQLHALNKREAARLDEMWTRRCAAIRHHVRKIGKDWNAADFSAPLDGLGDEIVNEETYRDAVNIGRKTFPGTHRDNADPIGDVWIGHIRKYADQVGPRVAEQLAEALPDTADEGVTLDDVLAALDAKLDALRSSITRYAEPPWGAGHNGYGGQLEVHNILMVWVLGDADHCTDCPDLADGSPYEHLPTWPGYGDTQCLDRCKCVVQADQDSWDASMGESA